MSAALAKGRRAERVSVPSNIYTALLGLAVLALAGTTAVVCIWAWQMYGAIFTAPPLP